MVIWENKTQKIKKLQDVTRQKTRCVKEESGTNTPLNLFFQTHHSEVFSKRDIGIIRYSYPHLWKKQKAIWDPLWGPATSLGGANEQGHYRSVSSGGAKHTGQRPNPQKMQSWLHFQSKLHEMETDLEISLSCGKSTPNINSRGYDTLFFIDAAKKGHLSPDARTHWHHVLCLHHNDLDYSVLDAPCENICLSFQSPNSEANSCRPEPQLIGASLGMVGRTHCHCLTYPGASSPTTCFLQPSRTTGGWPTARTLVFGLQWATSFWFFFNYRVIFRIDYPSEGLGEKKFYPG